MYLSGILCIYTSDISDVEFPLFVDRRTAIIPRGAEYCISGKEVVANKMIVFSSEEKFKEYMKKEKSDFKLHSLFLLPYPDSN